MVLLNIIFKMFFSSLFTYFNIPKYYIKWIPKDWIEVDIIFSLMFMRKKIF